MPAAGKEDWYADFRQTGGEIGIFQAPVAGKLARPPHGQIHLHAIRANVRWQAVRPRCETAEVTLI